MSNLTDLLPAGAGGKQVSFVASGTIGNGVTVGLNSDGTVTAVTILPDSVGSATAFDNAQSVYVSCSFDSSANKVVIAFRDTGNSNYGTAIVGTVSGNSISFGTAVVFESARSDFISSIFDSNSNKVVISYKDHANLSYGTAIVGTVSGTSISFGSAVVFETSSIEKTSTTFDSSLSKIVIAYLDTGNSNYGTAVVGTVSGTSISFGSPIVFLSSAIDYPSATFDSANGKVVIGYQDVLGSGSARYGEAVVGTVSGTSISFGSPVVFETARSDYISTTFDSSSNKVIISYQDAGNSQQGTAIVGSVSGTSISFGTAVVFETGATLDVASTFNSNLNKVVVAYRDGGNLNYGTVVTGTVSGTGISFDSPFVFNTASSQWISSVFDSSANKIVIGYMDGGNSSYGTAIVYSPASSNNTDFIGISDAAISDTASGSVTIKGGISTNVTELTPNALYYVQTDGSISSPTASSPYILSGASFTQSFSIAAQETAPQAVRFSANGTKMFVLGGAGQDVNEYTLSTGFDVSTASFVDSFSVSAQDTAPTGMAFNTDGTKMFIVGNIGDAVYEYTLSTGFDVSTATYSQSFSVTSQEINPLGLSFNIDGTKMFLVGFSGQDINEYTLSTGFDVSTASFTTNFSVAVEDSNPRDIAFNTSGTKMFVVGGTGDSVYEYTLSTGFDVSTAAFVDSFSVATQDTVPQSITFSTVGTKMFVVGATGDAVYQYSTGVGSATTVLAGKALSSTSINLDYTT